MNKKLTSYARSLYAVVKQFRLKGMMTAFTSAAEFSQLIRPIGSRPLILSGHPGDEVMAMGGAMAWYAKMKIPITVVTLTAGRHGTNTGKRNNALGPKRQKEQLAGFKVIEGEIKPHFWDLDEKFAVDDQLRIKLLDLIDELNPDVVYTPSLLDDHPDSQAISVALVQTLEKLPSTRLKAITIAQYELWTPIVPNKILSIDAFDEKKQKAIECHESQLLCRNYLDAMLGLNRYRAAMLGAGSVAEAYFVCSAKQYISFLDRHPAPVMEMVQ